MEIYFFAFLILIYVIFDKKTYLSQIMKQKILKNAVRTLQIESNAILGIIPQINQDFFTAAHFIYDNKTRVVVTGIGKSAIIARKIVATFNSTGTPAMFLHAADAVHGDIGMIQPKDVILLISKSGDTPEIKLLLPLLKRLNNKLIAFVSNLNSSLAKTVDIALYIPITEEAGPNNLAPSASTAAQMALGDALAFSVLQMRGFTSNDFAHLHPGGMLGKQLYLTVKDLYQNNKKPMVKLDDSIQHVIVEMTSKRLGATVVVNEQDVVSGMITDGDLRRMLESNKDLNTLMAKDIMSQNPKQVQEETLAIKALELMKQYNITQLIIMKDKNYVGMIHLHDFLKEGFH